MSRLLINGESSTAVCGESAKCLRLQWIRSFLAWDESGPSSHKMSGICHGEPAICCLWWVGFLAMMSPHRSSVVSPLSLVCGESSLACLWWVLSRLSVVKSATCASRTRPFTARDRRSCGRCQFVERCSGVFLRVYWSCAQFEQCPISGFQQCPIVVSMTLSDVRTEWPLAAAVVGSS